MIRHALSGTVATIAFGMQGTPTGSRLIAPPSFPLLLAAGFLRTGSDAVDLAAVTSPTNKNLTSTTCAQKHPARRFLHAFRAAAGSTCRKPAPTFCQLRHCSVLPTTEIARSGNTASQILWPWSNSRGSDHQNIIPPFIRGFTQPSTRAPIRLCQSRAWLCASCRRPGPFRVQRDRTACMTHFDELAEQLPLAAIEIVHDGFVLRPCRCHWRPGVRR
jgi:hypothetical protein